MVLSTQGDSEEFTAQLEYPYPPSSAWQSAWASLFTSTLDSSSKLGCGVAVTELCIPVALGEEGLTTSRAGGATAVGMLATETTPVARATVGAG